MTTSDRFSWARELAEQLAWYWLHVLHIHRELFRHGAEIALLRDLHRARSSQPVDDLTTGTLVP